MTAKPEPWKSQSLQKQILTEQETNLKLYIKTLLEHVHKIQKEELEATTTKWVIKPNLTAIELTDFNCNIMSDYGSSLYFYFLNLDTPLPLNFMLRHSFSKRTRTILIDWMIQIFSLYNSEPNTFFLTVSIMDKYVSKTRHKLSEDEYLWVGWTSIFIASKMEDIIPLHMKHIKTSFGQDKYSQLDILNWEKDILKTLNFDIVNTSTYEFIRLYIYDLCWANKEKISKWGIECHIKHWENLCAFLAKYLLWNEQFNKFKHSLQAWCCIMIGYDVIRTKSRNFTKEMQEFCKGWINYLIKSGMWNRKDIADCYEMCWEHYENAEKVFQIVPALKKIQFEFY